jgi:hypothetical protein
VYNRRAFILRAPYRTPELEAHFDVPFKPSSRAPLLTARAPCRVHPRLRRADGRGPHFTQGDAMRFTGWTVAGIIAAMLIGVVHANRRGATVPLAPCRPPLPRRLVRRMSLRGAHIMRGDGSGTTLYFGDKQGARFIGLDLRGFTGWSSGPHWMPGGWEFYTPTLYIGRLFMDRGHWHHLGTVKIPAKLIHAKRMLRRSYRDAMREYPQESA